MSSSPSPRIPAFADLHRHSRKRWGCWTRCWPRDRCTCGSMFEQHGRTKRFRLGMALAGGMRMNNPSTSSAVASNSVSGLAYQYFLDEGRPVGRDQEHWFRAEKALREAAEAKPAPRDVNGVLEVELSRFVAEGGSVSPVAAKTDVVSSSKGEEIRERSSTVSHAPRQMSRLHDRAGQTR